MSSSGNIRQIMRLFPRLVPENKEKNCIGRILLWIHGLGLVIPWFYFKISWYVLSSSGNIRQIMRLFPRLVPENKEKNCIGRILLWIHGLGLVIPWFYFKISWYVLSSSGNIRQIMRLFPRLVAEKKRWRNCGQNTSAILYSHPTVFKTLPLTSCTIKCPSSAKFLTI